MKQIKNLVYTLLLSVCCATMFTACSEEEGVVDAKDLVLSKEEVVFLAEPGESQSVTFTANADWRATSEQGWILIDTPVGKKGESTVSVSVKENTEKVSRQGNVIITEPSTGKMASFKVKQEAQGVNFVVSKEVGELYIDSEKKVISERINVAANFKYDIQIKGVDWVTYSIDDATKDIIFYADNEKATIEPKDITVNFVPEESEVETQSWTLRWDGFTPFVKFYKYKVEGNAQSELILVDGEVEFVKLENKNQVSLVVESNVPWKLLTDLSNTIISEVSNVEQGEQLERIFTNRISIFSVFDEKQLNSERSSSELSFQYENDNDETIDITFIKEGVGDKYIEIDNTAFNALKVDLTGTGWKMFSATANDEGAVLSIDIEVRTTIQEVHPIVMFYNRSLNPDKEDTYAPSSSMVITCKEIPSTRSIAQTKKFRLSVKDRSTAMMGDDGEVRYFKLFIAEKPDFNEYFEPTDESYLSYKLKDNETGICESIPFGQAAYVNEYTFESKDVAKDEPKVHNVDAKGGVLTIEYSSDEPGSITMYDEVSFTEDNKYIESGNLLNIDWAEFDYDSYVPGNKFCIKVKENNTGKEREVTIYLAAWLGDGKPEQYFGSFTIKQAAASPSTEQ